MEYDTLEIPAFLRRHKKRGRPRKIIQPDLLPVKDKWKQWDKIKQKRYGTRYDITLGDEAPRIGSGLRIVYVKEGRKWATMTSHTGDPDKKEGKVIKKFKLKIWYGIKAAHERRLKRNDPDEVAKRQSRRRYRKIYTNPGVQDQDTSGQNS